ncbi:unnamed protein product [Cuscuta campestris]|uniref:Uncharacterized protein n=1 Tax=Cuscuta campestris TaxID=132261 RepID=A0A484LTR6_9ASTE|nr:unnamed protein product [Cuscuta campestris]
MMQGIEPTSTDLFFILKSGDQGFNVPVTEARKLANKLVKEEQELITLQKNGPWYNGLQGVCSNENAMLVLPSLILVGA